MVKNLWWSQTGKGLIWALGVNRPELSLLTNHIGSLAILIIPIVNPENVEST